MRDEIDGRIWAAHHDGFSNMIGDALSGLRDGFARLQAIQFAAPWRSGTRRTAR